MVTPKGDKVSREKCLSFAPQPRANPTMDCAFAPFGKQFRVRRGACVNAERSRLRRSRAQGAEARIFRRECTKTYMTEKNRKPDNGLRVLVWKAVPRQTRSLRKRRKECTKTYMTEACAKATKYHAGIVCRLRRSRAQGAEARIFRRECTKTYMTEKNRKPDNGLRVRSRLESSSASDEEPA